MAKLAWTEIKNLRVNDPAPVAEVPDVQMVRVGGTDKKPKLGGMNRTIRRAGGRRGDGYRKVFQPQKSPKPGTVLDPRSRTSVLNRALRRLEDERVCYSFPDGCELELDGLGNTVMVDKSAEHDPAAHEGVAA